MNQPIDVVFQTNEGPETGEFGHAAVATPAFHGDGLTAAAAAFHGRRVTAANPAFHLDGLTAAVAAAFPAAIRSPSAASVVARFSSSSLAVTPRLLPLPLQQSALLPPLVLPPSPMDISFEDDDVIYGEDVEDEIVEPLRIFIGSGVGAPKKELDYIWDVEDELSFEDSEEEQPLQISIGGIATVQEKPPALSLGVATLANTSLPEEVFDDFETEEELTLYSATGSAMILSVRAPIRYDLYFKKMSLGITVGLDLMIPLAAMGAAVTADFEDPSNGSKNEDPATDLSTQLALGANTIALPLVLGAYYTF